MSIQGDIIKDYLKRFPSALSKTLARMVYRDNNEAFKDVEDVRDKIRYYRGAKGNRLRGMLKDKSMIRENGDKFRNPYGFPESEETLFEPFKIPIGNNNILLLSDIHVPYHSIEALTCALRYGKEQKVNTILLNGDIIDFYMLSCFVKDPRKRSVQYELDCLYEMLFIIQNEIPGAKIYYKEGNHEYRYEAYLKVKAPELLETSEFELKILLKLGEFGIDYIDKKRIIHAGKLNILHGHEFGRSYGQVNPARTLFLKTKECSIAGHNHQTSEHSETNLNGDPIACWSVGCLSELHPEYMPINKWNHGFAHVEFDKEGFSVHNKRIYNGKIL